MLSGADAAVGTDSQRAVEIAIADSGDGILGHPIEFAPEDSLCSAEGGQTAATKLASNPNVVVVVGPSCSSEAVAGAPILWRAGIPSIGTSTSAASLTASDREPGYQGFLRTIFNDIDQSQFDAGYVFNGADAKTVVTIHDGSAYASELVKRFKANYEKLGGKVVGEEAVQPNDVDMRPLLARIATTKPDLIYIPIFASAAGQLIRQAKETVGLEKTPLLGGSALLTPDVISAAGDSVVGFRIAYPDISPETMGTGYPRFVSEYTEKFGEAPISGYHANAYDAAMMAIEAIKKVAVDDGSGVLTIDRKALRDALFKTKMEGLTGQIDCDEHGQCAKFKGAVFEYVNADPATYKIGANPKKVFP